MRRIVPFGIVLTVLFSAQIAGFQTKSFAQSRRAANERTPVYPLGQAKSMSFEATLYEYDQHLQPPRFQKNARLSVKAIRPGSLRVDVLWTGNKATRTPTTVEFLNYTDADPYISDGRTEYSFNKALNTYTTKKAGRDLTGMYVDGMEQAARLFSKNPLREFKFKFTGDEILRGEPVAVYSLKEPVPNQPGWYLLTKLYLSKKTGLPVQISEWGQDNNRKWIEDAREEYAHWQINPDFPASTFDTTPSPGAKPFKPYVPPQKITPPQEAK